ncbi:nucleotidyltransferase family protein [Labedella endophytica]|uniref:Nucleotidyltransferase n=1 Tax=Labedella endophytica TaxID=1523160 RepID=A0A3S0VI42_9MICO|nr:nucleotidyltransferase domain-containing protein [Labedella endophytica]RUR03009.1 nucleotidyltransferase [Labedella endophytica]
MSTLSPDSVAVRELVAAHRDELDAVLRKYGATNPRLFGSMASGDAEDQSDIDLMVDLLPDERDSELLRISGLTVGLTRILGRPVDVVVPGLLRAPVSHTAMREAIPL